MDLQDKMGVPGEFRVTDYGVKSFSGEFRADYFGDPLDDRHRALDDEFGISAVVADAATEWDAFLALKRWVRSRWNHGWSMSFKCVDDGLSILRAAADGDQFCCGHYARVFVDCATALGWPARVVSVAIADCEFPRNHNVGNVGHSVAEIWSNEHEKWIAMDPDLNCFYELTGVPLSALEIRNAWLDGQADEVEQVLDEPGFTLPTGETIKLAMELTPGLNEFTEETVRLIFARFNRHRAMDYYARVRIGGWHYADERCLPTFVSHFRPYGRVRYTANVADMYQTLNMVRVATTPAWDDGSARLTVELEHCMPFFDRYESRVDGGPWERVESQFEWPMREGVNRLECRGVNVVGRTGIASSIDVAWARPRW